MAVTVQVNKLTHEGALKMLDAAVKKAEAMAVPQCIAIVDEGCHMLAYARMDGAKVLSFDTATAKAKTSASSRQPTGKTPPEYELKMAIATGGKFANLKGGLPIIVNGQCLGGIGVGSGTGDQDVECAAAALAAIGAQTTF
ncbi:MAG: GlcG/HbpS family heme-binding protein [Alphaproteobacteria bacterium]